MGSIIVYNIHKEDHTTENCNYYIGRGSPLGNPYTHIKDKQTLAKYICDTREEAINNYEKYFNEMYGTDKKFTDYFDEIYSHYKNGEDVYLQCFCKPLSCHGDFISKMLQKKLLKEVKQKVKK